MILLFVISQDIRTTTQICSKSTFFSEVINQLVEVSVDLFLEGVALLARGSGEGIFKLGIFPSNHIAEARRSAWSTAENEDDGGLVTD